MKKHIVKLLKGQDVDANLSVRVLAVGLGMQEDYLLAKKKKKEKTAVGCQRQEFAKPSANSSTFLTLQLQISFLNILLRSVFTLQVSLILEGVAI